MVENNFSSPRNVAFPAGLRVLVVDDDSTWSRILENMLKKCSYEVTTCGFARDALNLLRESQDTYDIVISDAYMPDMDGFELLEHIGLEMDLPVIMMSVDRATSRVMKPVQRGACDYLLKPIRMKELRNVWQHVFRKKIHEVRDIEILEGTDHIQMTKDGSDQSDDGHFLWGEDLTSIKKRKDDKGLGDNSFVKKARIVWLVGLHQKFVNAVAQIGLDKVGPEKILNLMNVPWLTRENVAAYWQKYRLYLSRLQKQDDLAITFEGISYSHATSGDSTASGGTQYSCNMQHPDVSNNNYRISVNGLPLNYLEPGNYESDQERTVSMPVAASRISLTTDVSDFWKSRDSQSEFSNSCSSSESEVNFAAFDPTFLFVPSSHDEKKHEDNKQEHKVDEKEHKDGKEEQTWSRNHKSDDL